MDIDCFGVCGIGDEVLDSRSVFVEIGIGEADGEDRFDVLFPMHAYESVGHGGCYSCRRGGDGDAGVFVF